MQHFYSAVAETVSCIFVVLSCVVIPLRSHVKQRAASMLLGRESPNVWDSVWDKNGRSQEWPGLLITKLEFSSESCMNSCFHTSPPVNFECLLLMLRINKCE